VKNDHDSDAPSAPKEGVSPLQLEPLKAAKKRCKGVNAISMRTPTKLRS